MTLLCNDDVTVEGKFLTSGDLSESRCYSGNETGILSVFSVSFEKSVSHRNSLLPGNLDGSCLTHRVWGEGRALRTTSHKKTAL